MTRRSQKAPNLKHSMKSLCSPYSGHKNALIFAIFILVILVSQISIGVAFSSNTGNSKNIREIAESDADFSIEGLSPYVIDGSPLQLTIKTNKLNSNVKVKLLSPTNTRSGLFDFVNNLSDRRVKDSIGFPLSDFTPLENALGTYTIDVPVNADTGPSLSLTSAGIYPVAVSIETADGSDIKTQYSFTTNIPAVGANGSAYSQRLEVVPLVTYAPVIDRSALLNQTHSLTSYGKEIQSKLAEAQTAFGLISSTQTPFSVVLSPEVFDTYSSIQKPPEVDRINAPLFAQSSNKNIEYIVDTYVPINIAELEKRGLSSEYIELVTKGRTRIKNTEFSAPARTLVTKSITNDSVEIFARSGIDQVIVDEDTFSSTQRPTHKPVSLTQNNTSIRVAAKNTAIAKNLPTSLSDSARSNYLVAATSVVALESPSIKRGFILPLDMNTLSGATISQFLKSTTNSPLIKTATTERFFQDMPDDKNLEKKLARAKFPEHVASTFSVEEFEEMNQYLSATNSMVNPDTELGSIAKWMKSAAYSSSDRKISRYVSVEKAQDLTLSVKKSIALPEKRTLTITSREDKIPVTIKNSYGSPLSVVVSISSDKLAFPEGSEFPIVLADENSTIQIPVRARTSGSFPVTIKLLTPEGSIEIGSRNATVRSTVVSGSGIAIAVSSLLFLAIWWASHYRKTKKKPIAPIIELNQETLV